MTKEQVLINHIQEYLDSGMWQYEACYLNKNDLKVIIKALEQEPKTGHWYKSSCDICYTCSFCGVTNASGTKYNYCPHCGAKMTESEEKE